jgi:hypothetical protein
MTINSVYHFMMGNRYANNIIENLLTLHNCLPFQENAINCKRKEANDKILSINVYYIYNLSMNFLKFILEKDTID